MLVPGPLDQGAAPRSPDRLYPAMLQVEAVAPGVEGLPGDGVVVACQLGVAAAQVADQGFVMGQNQDLLSGIKLAEQTRPIDQDERFAAARHSAYQAQRQVPGGRLLLCR